MTKRDMPYRENPMLRWSYSLIAPLYDLAISAPLLAARTRSLRSLPTDTAGRVLLNGIGTGLDLPLLPKLHQYTALDFNAAMLSRARPRGTGLQVEWVLGDSMALPFPDAHFDHVVLHLILAVVPAPTFCLAEAVRVLKPGGQLLIFDKFLRRGEGGWKRLLNPLTRHVATRLDVVFEDLLDAVGGIRVTTNEAALASGWFRLIRLEKATF